MRVISVNKSLLRDLEWLRRVVQSVTGSMTVFNVRQHLSVSDRLCIDLQFELVDVFDHEMSSFLFQCAPSSLWQVFHVDILGNVLE
ncbi:hypothetical protein Tco_0674579 [Tanacetum coccineum]